MNTTDSRSNKIFGTSRRDAHASDTLVGMRDLPAMGIAYHPHYLRKLWERGAFPRPNYLSPRKLCWKRSELDRWIQERTTGNSRKDALEELAARERALDARAAELESREARLNAIETRLAKPERSTSLPTS